MNRFEDICATCPLRTKVDVVRASETDDWKAPGDVCHLSDGVRTYAVRYPTRDAMCEHPTDRLLRKKCGIGLASAWRWAEKIGRHTPNIAHPDELLTLLGEADYSDAMPHYVDGAWLFGDTRDYSELSLHDPAFTNCGIVKLAATVRGIGAELPTGKAIMLDRVSLTVTDASLQDVFRLRIAQGGPHFAFRSSIAPYSNKDEYAENIARIFADGIYAYLHSDDTSVKESNELLINAHDAAEERARQLQGLHDSDNFLSGTEPRAS